MNASSFSPHNSPINNKKSSSWRPLTGPLNDAEISTSKNPDLPLQPIQPIQPVETEVEQTFSKDFAEPVIEKTSEHPPILSTPDENQESTQRPKEKASKRATIKKVILIGLIVSFVAVLASGAMLMIRARNVLPSIQDIPMENTPIIDSSIDETNQLENPIVNEDASPSADASAPIISPVPITISTIDWQEHKFINENLSIKMPKTFSADSQNFIDKKEKLIRFWSKIDPSTAEMQIEIRSEWLDSALENVPRTFEISEGLLAAKVDPTSNKGEQPDSSISTKYYFERKSVVYTFICRHEWEMNMYQTCEAALKTLKFTN